MSDRQSAVSGDVHTSVNYMIPMSEKPARYLGGRPDGVPELNWQLEARAVEIHDGRSGPRELSLEDDGLMCCRRQSAVKDFFDPAGIEAVYYPEVERLVKDLSGARRVIAFDNNLRSASKDRRSDAAMFPPARFAHADYTPKSSAQRIRDLLPAAEAQACLERRYKFINVWRPLSTVHDDALAVCAAHSVAAEDLVATDLIYPERTGEIYNITFNPAHRWYYFRHMEAADALVFANFDSAGGRVVPHTAFTDPTAAAGAPPRESIEVRVIACF